MRDDALTIVGVTIAVSLALFGTACSGTDVSTGSQVTRAPSTTRVMRLPAPTASQAAGFAISPSLSADVYRAARKFWNDHRPNHYRWTYEQYCFCSEPSVEVEVLGHRIVNVTRRPPATGTETNTDALAVDPIFDSMGRALAEVAAMSTTPKLDTGAMTDPNECRYCTVIYASFDPTYGFPLEYGSRTGGLTDSQEVVVPSEFVVLDP